MTTSITVRDVPDEVRDELASRAADLVATTCGGLLPPGAEG